MLLKSLLLEDCKTCTKCRLEIPIENFSVTKRNEDGTVKRRNSWCNGCRTNQNRERLGLTKRNKTVVDDVNQTKSCANCLNVLQFSSFYKSKKGSGGLSAYCKECEYPRFKNLEKQKEAVRRYRLNNLYRWRAMHRVHQFNRRQNIKATDDGTVTDEFLISLYETENCFWCKNYISEDKRTLEHIKELSQGGTHSAENITMACVSCNSSRKGKIKIDV